MTMQSNFQNLTLIWVNVVTVRGYFLNCWRCLQFVGRMETIQFLFQMLCPELFGSNFHSQYEDSQSATVANLVVGCNALLFTCRFRA